MRRNNVAFTATCSGSGSGTKAAENNAVALVARSPVAPTLNSNPTPSALCVSNYNPYTYYPSLFITKATSATIATGRKGKGKKRSGAATLPATEDALQRTVSTYLARMLPPLAIHWATPNDSGGRERVQEGARRKAMGRVAGIPDLFVLHQGKLIGLELKRPAPILASGKASRAAPAVSDAQAHTMARLNAAGAQCFVCRSVGEVEAALRLCGVPLGRTSPFHVKQP